MKSLKCPDIQLVHKIDYKHYSFSKQYLTLFVKPLSLFVLRHSCIFFRLFGPLGRRLAKVHFPSKVLELKKQGSLSE